MKLGRRLRHGFDTEAIRTNPGFGRGSGPVNHHAQVTFGRAGG